jgi:hypothetical protein
MSPHATAANGRDLSRRHPAVSNPILGAVAGRISRGTGTLEHQLKPGTRLLALGFLRADFFFSND